MRSSDEESWEERYRSSTAIWSGNPNAQLVAEAAGLAPGVALDAGCGEGADAIWLAAHGWRVTAVDFSTVALGRAAAHAAERGVADRVTWVHADLAAWTPPEAGFDLVSAHFLQLPPERRVPLFARLAAGVAPAGTLLIVAHHPSDLETTVRRPREPARFYTAEQLEASLDPAGWDVVAADARPRPATDPDGRTVTIHDTVLRARRRDE